jgi:hypothetical protein
VSEKPTEGESEVDEVEEEEEEEEEIVSDSEEEQQEVCLMLYVIRLITNRYTDETTLENICAKRASTEEQRKEAQAGRESWYKAQGHGQGKGMSYHWLLGWC